MVSHVFDRSVRNLKAVILFCVAREIMEGRKLGRRRRRKEEREKEKRKLGCVCRVNERRKDGGTKKESGRKTARKKKNQERGI